MPRVYTIDIPSATIATASGDYDFVEIDPATDKPVEIMAIFLANKSELGDAQEEFVEYAVVHGNTTSGNGTSATPRPLDVNDTASGATCETVSSTPASAGTAINLWHDTFNIRAGLQLVFPPDMRPRAAGAALLCVRLLTALADDATMLGTVTIREL